MNKQNAFSLAEVVITLSLVIVVMAFSLSMLKQRISQPEQSKIKHTYAQVLTVIESMISDTTMYPTAAGFNNTINMQDPLTGVNYGGTTKFAELFRSKLNILDDNVPIPATATRVPLVCNDVEPGSTCPRIAVNANSLNCFTTNNNVTFCLPTDSTRAFATDTSIAVIRIYYNYNRATTQDTDGFYVGVKRDGSVYVLPYNVCLNGTAGDRCTRLFSCEDLDIYKNTNQCRMDELLTKTKNIVK